MTSILEQVRSDRYLSKTARFLELVVIDHGLKLKVIGIRLSITVHIYY